MDKKNENETTPLNYITTYGDILEYLSSDDIEKAITGKITNEEIAKIRERVEQSSQNNNSYEDKKR